MSKQLIDQKEQGNMIVRMNNSVIGISDTSYTGSHQSQSGSWKLEVPRKGSPNLRELKTGIMIRGLAKEFMKW